jgi:hypothetical protein
MLGLPALNGQRWENSQHALYSGSGAEPFDLCNQGRPSFLGSKRQNMQLKEADSEAGLAR